MKSNTHWDTHQIPDLNGKVIIVTGANSGIGYEATRAFVRKNGKVILASRNQTKVQAAIQKIKVEIPYADLVDIPLDLADLNSIHRFSHDFHQDFNHLDILINNAGIMATPRQKTEDGFELQFGVNHLGHFALTGLLLDILISTPGSRVVTVSSIAHLFGILNFFDLNSEKFYQRWLAYCKSKLANLYFAYELQRKLRKSGNNSISLAAHPGYASTNLQDETFFKFLNKFIAQSQEMGALPTLFAATSPEANGCDFITPDSFFQQRGYPRKTKSSRTSYNQVNAAKLWSESENLTGISYSFKSQD